MKKIVSIALVVAAFSSKASFANVEGAEVPVAVYTVECDANPRIVVHFQGSRNNVWYPARNPAADKFLSTALMAKATGKKFYYVALGNEKETELTNYCVPVGNGRFVGIFGIVD